jgi:IS30 family transposase
MSSQGAPEGRADIPSKRPKRKETSSTPRPSRATFSLTEGDLIIGKEQASQIGTLVERSTGFVQLLHLPDTRTADVVAEAMTATIKAFPVRCAAP